MKLKYGLDVLEIYNLVVFLDSVSIKNCENKNDIYI